MIQNVLFDLDGTLLDTTEGVIESVKYTIDKLGYDHMGENSLLSFIGPPIQESFIRVYGCNEESANEAAGIFRDYYKNKALFKAKPYPGIHDVCEKLLISGRQMAVATYKREDYAIQIVEHFGFDKYCKSVRGSIEGNTLSKKDIIRLCMQDIDAADNNTVLVGDTVYDADGAMKAGIKFIGVKYGFGFKDEEAFREYDMYGTAEDPIELLDIIKG